jgi:NADPH:quinone reductase-like Zn-dependent oxidoreductase
MAQNRAAWIEAAKANPLVVGDAPYWTPGKDQLLIKNGAVAINPVDWKVQDSGTDSSLVIVLFMG